MTLTCPLCPRHCVLAPGQTGFCRARENRDGKIVDANYGRITSLALDPIEKKPLRRFHPGSFILSVGSYGCNLLCPFCQNSEISMADGSIRAPSLSPEKLSEQAVALSKRPPGNLGLAFTYNEPLVGYEYVRDCAQLIHQVGLYNVVVTNGSICKGPLKGLLPLIDAMNIDLKGFRQQYYDWLGGNLATVKGSIALSARQCHVEVTTLIVPGRNDSDGEMEAEARWLASINPEIPLHISRFFPRWKVQALPPTPVETVRRLCGIARKYLRYVYSGNC